MTFNGFKAQDFNVFQTPGLDDRMEQIISQIRPKLETLGNRYSEELTAFTGEEMFFHVAKHARRTVNPPKDTWVAFAPNKEVTKCCHIFRSDFGKHMFSSGLLSFTKHL